MKDLSDGGQQNAFKLHGMPANLFHLSNDATSCSHYHLSSSREFTSKPQHKLCVVSSWCDWTPNGYGKLSISHENNQTKHIEIIKHQIRIPCSNNLNRMAPLIQIFLKTTTQQRRVFYPFPSLPSLLQCSLPIVANQILQWAQ